MSILLRGLRRVSKSAFPATGWTRRKTGVRFMSDGNSQSTEAFKLLYPEAPSKDHSDLATFLSYVERTQLSKRTSVYQGTHYEYTVADTLSRYGFFLKRVGGASDRGTDLLGTWKLPSTSHTMQVILQCKSGARAVGPMYVRELKGAIAVAPPGWRNGSVLGLMVGEKPATKGVLGEMHSAENALGYVCCSKEGEVRQLLWNLKAQDIGLQGVSVGVRYEGKGEGESKTLVLLRNGKALPLLKNKKKKSAE
ncbi:hypothetical protein FZEAL_6927 [Fusarium zealandicum]|uniref:Uncharacterized protein n=1 Tax=Fusarium zealandicum TaxID=1053134 RepID=A0A8H4UGT4_9HYPO|nr:hypothetical protein FZEAL_6927 [Fusarium zealandicum]